MALSPGTWLGSYEILNHIGSSGMGEVYRARDSKLNREVATANGAHTQSILLSLLQTCRQQNRPVLHLQCSPNPGFWI